jgi:serine/threonine protein kinase
MSTEVLQRTNQLLLDTAALVPLVQDPKVSQIRQATEVDWENSKIVSIDEELRKTMVAMKLLTEHRDGVLTFDAAGRAFLGKLLLRLGERLVSGAEIAGRYILGNKLAGGKNSLAFTAEDTRLGRTVVLKFFRPGRGEGIIANIPLIGRVRGDPVLVNPLDVFQHEIADDHGALVPLNVVVFPFVEGMTLRSYLANERNSSPVVIQAFIEQTCFALNALEEAGLTHGDLHPNNIMVTTEPSGRAAFRVIDVSHGADKPSEYELPKTDLDGFKLILRLALYDIQSRLSRISLKRHLGARLFTLVEYILTDKAASFAEIRRELETGVRFSAVAERKDSFVREKFRPPRDFGILRYEELSNPNVAFELFCPYPELFERLCAFGSAVLFGHRGTGKSTYMAAMNFFPEADDPPLDYRKQFGVLFSCRQGEFRKFSSRHLRVTSEFRLKIKDILVAKIIRKTLGSLAAGVAKERLRAPTSVAPIADLILPRVQRAEGIMISHRVSEIESLKATMLEAEVNLIDRLFAGEPTPPQSSLLDEHSLTDFFNAIRICFSELNQARFSILFDDAGAPNVPQEVHGIICDLMASTNSVYCVKLSAEKKTFQFLTSDKKPIERVHDVRMYTISDYFSLGGGFANDRRSVEEYFRQVVGVRLRVCGFQSTDIREYLGVEVMKADEIVARLVSRSRGEPVYAGWQIVWQIADRTLRHLLEMISAIFDVSKTTPRKPPSIIPHHLQSRQILRFSGDKLRGLMFLPGTVVINGEKQGLGKALYEFAASFGKVSAHYLQSSSPSTSESERLRFDERLAIEIDNTLRLSADAQRMLDELIRFAVLDDEKMATAFDDGTRKPIYIFNKVYCPILRISFRHDAHWRLSSRRFEQFLLHPSEFVRTDKRLTRLLDEGSPNNDTLFE